MSQATASDRSGNHGRDSRTDATERENALLFVRCGGRHGRCGRILAVIFDFGAIELMSRTCHNFDCWFEQPEVAAAYKDARWAKKRARRLGTRFRPRSVVVRPLPLHQETDMTPFRIKDRQKKQQGK
jgi:hypothetical protein